MNPALKSEAERLAGRELEVEQTRDGRFIVLFMAFGESPPPKGDTPDEALSKFIDWAKARPAPAADELKDGDLGATM